MGVREGLRVSGDCEIFTERHSFTSESNRPSIWVVLSLSLSLSLSVCECVHVCPSRLVLDLKAHLVSSVLLSPSHTNTSKQTHTRWSGQAGSCHSQRGPGEGQPQIQLQISTALEANTKARPSRDTERPCHPTRESKPSTATPTLGSMSVASGP